MARAAVLVVIVTMCVLLTLYYQDKWTLGAERGTVINAGITPQAESERLKPEAGQPAKIASNTNPLLFAEDVGTGPLAHVRRNGYVLNLTKLDVDKLTDEELIMTMHSYPDNADVLCRRKFRMGKIGDGGWEICDDPDIRPRSPCIIYSFGISYDFSFDDDASKNYGCHVYSFDPSMDKMALNVNRSELVHFYKIGLDGKTYTNDKKWPLYSLTDIRKLLGHQNAQIDVIKIDIESSEWPALPQLVEAGELKNVRQLLMEYHVTSSSRDYLLPRLKALQAIERAGFRKFYVHKNFACATNINGYPIIRTMCYEVHYLKR